jgi:predicted SAM-dependent methyltransferase
MKIQFCSGGNLLQGFLNTDLYAPDPLDRIDITKPLPFANETVDFVFCEHGFEHVTAPDGLRFLDECFRILIPGGTIRLCVPVLDRLGYAQSRDIILNHGHLAAYQDWQSLKRFLKVAGFREVKTTPRKDTDGHWKVIGEEKDDLETCRLEAVKP